MYHTCAVTTGITSHNTMAGIMAGIMAVIMAGIMAVIMAVIMAGITRRLAELKEVVRYGNDLRIAQNAARRASAGLLLFMKGEKMRRDLLEAAQKNG